MRQILGLTCGNNEGVFDAHPAFAGHVNAGFHGKRHALDKFTLPRGCGVGSFVQVQAHAVTGGVHEVFAVAGVGNDVTAGLVHVGKFRAGNSGGHTRKLGF